MISICNVSESYSRKGLQKYLVRINNVVLAEFDHISEEGMEVCIQKAAKAIRNMDIDEKIRNHKLQELYKAISNEV